MHRNKNFNRVNRVFCIFPINAESCLETSVAQLTLLTAKQQTEILHAFWYQTLCSICKLSYLELYIWLQITPKWVHHTVSQYYHILYTIERKRNNCQEIVFEKNVLPLFRPETSNVVGEQTEWLTADSTNTTATSLCDTAQMSLSRRNVLLVDVKYLHGQ